MQLGGLDQGPDLPLQGRRLGRVHHRDVAVLVQQLLQPGDVAVGLGPGHRRHQVIDDRGVGPALGLGALAGIVDQERVDQRHRADRRVGAAGRRTCRASCPAATRGCRACPRAPPRARRTPARASGRSPGSGGSAPDRDRGRWRSGSRRSPAAAGPRSRGCRPAAPRRRSRPRGPATGRRTARRAPGPRPASPRRPGRRAGRPASAGRSLPGSASAARTAAPGQPLRVLPAGVDQRVDQGVAGSGVGVLALDLG